MVCPDANRFSFFPGTQIIGNPGSLFGQNCPSILFIDGSQNIKGAGFRPAHKFLRSIIPFSPENFFGGFRPSPGGMSCYGDFAVTMDFPSNPEKMNLDPFHHPGSFNPRREGSEGLYSKQAFSQKKPQPGQGDSASVGDDRVKKKGLPAIFYQQLYHFQFQC